MHSELFFVFSVSDPAKFWLLVQDVHLQVKKVDCSVERAMRFIGKDRRVLTRFKGIYHLRVTNKARYNEVGVQMFTNVPQPGHQIWFLQCGHIHANRNNISLIVFMLYYIIKEYALNLCLMRSVELQTVPKYYSKSIKMAQQFILRTAL